MESGGIGVLLGWGRAGVNWHVLPRAEGVQLALKGGAEVDLGVKPNPRIQDEILIYRASTNFFGAVTLENP